MSLISEIERIEQAKVDINAAIKSMGGGELDGVSIDDVRLDDYPDYIRMLKSDVRFINVQAYVYEGYILIPAPSDDVEINMAAGFGDLSKVSYINDRIPYGKETVISFDIEHSWLAGEEKFYIHSVITGIYTGSYWTNIYERKNNFSLKFENDNSTLRLYRTNTSIYCNGLTPFTTRVSYSLKGEDAGL